ncbi:MAG: glutamine-hydrolyzing carbamoyl-phosphate synthase small subunit [Anaerolineae bacterium]|nr:glutamine-hydrolyzing carbamoyl-phosphate synthase small subunit [Anaerolineae bacterium]
MAILALEDGTIFHGESLGAEGEICAEVVFNTSLTGYQEIITDPSYRGQMIVFTCTHIGNVGVNAQDNESPRAQCAAIIARDITTTPSNWRAQKSLPEWLRERNVIALSGVDTRALTRHLRERGVMKGAISTQDDDAARLVEKARVWEGLDGRDLVREVTCDEAYVWDEATLAEFEYKTDDRRLMTEDVRPPSSVVGRPSSVPSASLRASLRPHIVVYDFGVKHNILRRLVSYGCRVTVVPATTSARDVLALDPAGIVLSNGPGDPAGLPYAVETIRELLAHKIPMFGICLGHQLLGLALGGRTYKLKFGHHGGNHPVLHLATGRVAITAQNHNYAVDADSLDSARVEITERSLNDGCVEAMRLKDAPVFSVQYHPEASPGPHDADDWFKQFVQFAFGG